MGNVSRSRGCTERIKSRWNRLLYRRAVRPQQNLDIEALMHAYQAADLRTCPPPEPPPLFSNTVVMTNLQDSDTCSVHTVNSSESDDSLFDIPDLAPRHDDSSSDGSTDFFTCSDNSSFVSAWSSSRTTSTTDTSGTCQSTFSLDSLGPPPPGSLMDLWDKPIPTSCLHNFPSRLEDAKCTFFESLSPDTDSVSSIEYPNSDGDSFLSSNPISSRPLLHLTRVNAFPQVIGLAPSSSRTIGGELVDSGGNFNMTNDLGLLLNVVAIKPFSIGMAAQESRSSSMCTHRGDFPLLMMDGSIFYTPMFFNPSASETIRSNLL
jgi:hypothetical protein